MDKLNTLVSLNDAKKTIDELIVRLKHNGEELTDSSRSRKALIIALSVLGALVLVAVIAYAVYRHFSNESLDYEDLLDEDADDEDEDDEASEDDEEDETADSGDSEEETDGE